VLSDAERQHGHEIRYKGEAFAPLCSGWDFPARGSVLVHEATVAVMLPALTSLVPITMPCGGFLRTCARVASSPRWVASARYDVILGCHYPHILGALS
jgi:hypothetical protein